MRNIITFNCRDFWRPWFLDWYESLQVTYRIAHAIRTVFSRTVYSTNVGSFPDPCAKKTPSEAPCMISNGNSIFWNDDWITRITRMQVNFDTFSSLSYFIRFSFTLSRTVVQLPRKKWCRPAEMIRTTTLALFWRCENVAIRCVPYFPPGLSCDSNIRGPRLLRTE